MSLLANTGAAPRLLPSPSPDLPSWRPPGAGDPPLNSRPRLPLLGDMQKVQTVPPSQRRFWCNFDRLPAHPAASLAHCGCPAVTATPPAAMAKAGRRRRSAAAGRSAGGHSRRPGVALFGPGDPSRSPGAERRITSVTQTSLLDSKLWLRLYL